jgi:hypothetical protein
MTKYHVIVEGEDGSFEHGFDGEPQIGLTFEVGGVVYKVTTRAHDQDEGTMATLHAHIV